MEKISEQKLTGCLGGSMCRANTLSIGIILTALLITLTLIRPAQAAHPLISDDTGTQGTGKFQLEVNGEYGSDREESQGIETTERAVEAGVTLAYGASDTVDVIIGIPYLQVEGRETDITIPASTLISEKGLSDVAVELKWRFFEREGLSMALKPGISMPTGDEEKGLGAGKYGFGMFFIATEEFKPLTFHQNIGYIRNSNRFDEREDIYHVSVACEYELVEGLRVVANIGQERNPDKASDRDPAFGLIGIIYAITEHIDVDGGVKIGITDPETDRTVLAGMAVRF
ncbi:MAG: transporter [Nitrospirota bacterium]|nr:transporter [Nitrospirota bacterium]